MLLPSIPLRSPGAYGNLHPHVLSVAAHRVVVHNDNFVDPLTGIHTQEAESPLARLKYHVKREKGIRAADIQDFLNEQMWRVWKGLDAVFENASDLIKNYHPL